MDMLMGFLLRWGILISIYGNMLSTLVMMIIFKVVLTTVLVLDAQEDLLLHLLEKIIIVRLATFGSLNISEYYTDDPVWDGAGCLVNNNCCANVNQPWFFHQLVTARQDNIAGRLCTRYEFENEAILVEEIQLYVQ